MTVGDGIGSLGKYSLLGRTGLRVSPLAFGALTFGNETGFGVERDTAKALFDTYLAAGGNFIDTSDAYSNGDSERMLGEFMEREGNRARIVLATKYSFTSSRGDPNAAGNSRKNIYQCIEGSLRRLKTDYIDLYWMHIWDRITPVEEVVETFNDLIRAGKIRYYGFSNVPAWYFSRAQTIAQLRGNPGLAALQLEYALTERTIEREHIPGAIELGVGVTTWGSLAGGFLTGKYRKVNDASGAGSGRLAIETNFVKFYNNTYSKRNWDILALLEQIAARLGKSPAQVAINWITKRPGINSTIIGASKISQLEANLQALEFDIPEDLAKKLEEASRPEPAFPYYFYTAEWDATFVAADVSKEPEWYR